MFGFDYDSKDLFKGVEQLLAKGTKEIEAGVWEASEALRGDATDIVPFDKGFNGGLAGSASSSNPIIGDVGPESEVGFNMPYAARLHEDMTLHISQKNAVAGQRRQQKYLEGPAKRNAQKYGAIIAAAFQRVLNG